MHRPIALAAALSLTLGAAALSVTPASAQSSADLVRALAVSPHAVTVQSGHGRTLVVRPNARRVVMAPNAPAKPVIATPYTVQQLHQMATRRVVARERHQLAAVVAANQLPSIDMEIYFAYDSAAIDPSALGGLQALGQALSDPQLSGRTFLIAGHTDAAGGDVYNQSLSERRAWSVKSFLVSNFAIDPQTLIAVGYGEEQLKDVHHPGSGINRRVQMVNLAP
jgi:outer membrane protein OmpA-like peptidoglycan-associated protein